MSDETSPRRSTQSSGRIVALDVARGVALIAMAIYHFTWDLDNFGYVARGLATEGGWRIFARCIATSFLVLVGISLVLAHANGIRWRPFLMRLTQVAAGAAAISVVTAFVTPESFVFFGILHLIAVASLLGLVFLRLPWFANAALAAATVALPFLHRSEVFDPKPLAWIGLFAKAPVTNDSGPVFPWFGAVLAGIAIAQLAARTGALDRSRRSNPAFARARPLAFIGRHSLSFYLVHQPLLFGLVFLATQVSPPDRTALLEAECIRNAYLGEESPGRCAAFSACTVSELKVQGLLQSAFDSSAGPEDQAKVRAVAEMCALRP